MREERERSPGFPRLLPNGKAWPSDLATYSLHLRAKYECRASRISLCLYKVFIYTSLVPNGSHTGPYLARAQGPGPGMAHDGPGPGHPGARARGIPWHPEARMGPGPDMARWGPGGSWGIRGAVARARGPEPWARAGGCHGMPGARAIPGHPGPRDAQGPEASGGRRPVARARSDVLVATLTRASFQRWVDGIGWVGPTNPITYLSRGGWVGDGG